MVIALHRFHRHQVKSGYTISFVSRAGRNRRLFPPRSAIEQDTRLRKRRYLVNNSKENRRTRRSRLWLLVL